MRTAAHESAIYSPAEELGVEYLGMHTHIDLRAGIFGIPSPRPSDLASIGSVLSTIILLLSANGGAS